MRLLFAAALAAVVASPAMAQTKSELAAQEARGEALVVKLCATCHAVGRTGVSPHAEAPAFRTLGQRYRIEALEEALGEGIITGHPDMPEFQFSADEVGDVIAYLNSVQSR